MNTEQNKKPQSLSPYAGAGIALGAGIGVALGAAFDQLAMGLAVGTAIGASLDVIMHVRKKS